MEIILECRQTHGVGEYGRVPYDPLVVPGLVVVADPHLSDGGDLHALEDVPRPRHAVLDGDPQFSCRLSHLQEPVSTQEEVPLQGREVVVDGVEPVLLVHPEVPIPLGGGQEELPETGVVREGVVPFDDKIVLSPVLLGVVSVCRPVPVVGKNGPASLLHHVVYAVGKDGRHGRPVLDAVGYPFVVPPRVDLEVPERYALLVSIALYGQQDLFVVWVGPGVVVVACAIVGPVAKVVVCEVVAASSVVFLVQRPQKLSPRFHRSCDILAPDHHRFEIVLRGHRVDRTDDAETDGWGRGRLGLPGALRGGHKSVGGRYDDGVLHGGVEYDQRGAAVYSTVEGYARRPFVHGDVLGESAVIGQGASVQTQFLDKECRKGGDGFVRQVVCRRPSHPVSKFLREYKNGGVHVSVDVRHEIEPVVRLPLE